MKIVFSTVVLALLAVACATPEQDAPAAGFETRALATGDLRAEQERLETWLALDGNRAMVVEEPTLVHRYNAQGSDHIAWYPRRVLPSSRNPDLWGFSLAMQAPEDGTVALFGESDWNDGTRPPQAPAYLVELLAIDVQSPYFTQDDLESDSFVVEMNDAGQAQVNYRIAPERRDAYAAWTQSMLNEKVAIIVNGEVLAAPIIRGRIRSVGVITGSFSEEEAHRLVRSIQSSMSR